MRVGDHVRVLERDINPILEQHEPDLAAWLRWQMGRVFRIRQVSPTGHVELDACDVAGNTPPVAHSSFLHPSMVERVTE